MKKSQDFLSPTPSGERTWSVHSALNAKYPGVTFVSMKNLILIKQFSANSDTMRYLDILIVHIS